MIELYEHNQQTYKNLIRLFESNNRVACVQPTGTGKSFIMLKLIEDNPGKRFLITSPSVYIFEQIRDCAAENGVDISSCEFYTYQRIVYMSDEDIKSIKADYIFLDEFHRLGSPKWGGRGIEFLLETHKNSKILGTSATPIRYLDSMRNMAEEIFSNCYAVNMHLAEAIKKKILPLPVYVTAWYSFSGDIAKIESKLLRTENQYLRNVLYGKIQKAKSMIADIDCGLEKILEKHIDNKNGKYIIFCPNSESIERSRLECRSWFAYVNKNINIYEVYSYSKDVRQQFEDFKNDNSENTLKILFCIDMLNEGVHINGIDGVIMLRATHSANVFYQQLGRALSCSRNRPVIFDIVNNYETGDTAKEYADIMQMGRTYCASENESDIVFEIYDYVKDIRLLLDDIYMTFEECWETTFELLCEFVKRFERFPYNKEKYRDYMLGTWCVTQRVLFNKNKLSASKIEKLESIGFAWDTRDELWNGKFNILKEFKEKNGRFIERRDTYDDNEIRSVYTWSVTQRKNYKMGELSAERIQKLKEIGFEFTVCSIDERWEESYGVVKQFYLEYNRFPVKQDIESGKVDIKYSWIAAQRRQRRNNKLSQNQIKKLNEVNFVWDTEEDNWNGKFRILERFIYENNRMPKTMEKYGGCDIGQWYSKQLTYLKNGHLSDTRKDKLYSLERIVTSYIDEMWIKKFNLLVKFIGENDRLPYSTEVYEGFELYKWINKQKYKLKEGKLDHVYLEKFKSIDVDLMNFSSCKSANEPPRAWVEFYTEYKDFVAENSRVPNRSEGRLYRWRRRQIQAMENNRLNGVQQKMLAAIHFNSEK